MPGIVTIQFNTAGKLYEVSAGNLEVKLRDKVVVDSDRGVGIATVVRCTDGNAASYELPLIRRIATEEDLDILEQNNTKEKEAYDFCNRRIIERNMQMKLVRVEYLFDGSKAVFYFTADGRVDFRDLVKDLAHTFHTRIEMRQIGVRDESKMVGGIGICGRELCCCSWLRDFQPVSVKMAKEQNLALNPNKISGQCGRLLCCLDYEYETYCSLRKTFPKCGKRVRTESVTGVVDKIHILTGAISLRVDDGKIVLIKKKDILGEAAAVEEQPKRQDAPAQTVRVPQKSREKRQERPARQQQQQTPEVPVKSPPPLEQPLLGQESTPAVKNAVETGKPEDQAASKPRKKSRFRKHGHRKPGTDGSSGAA